MAGVRAKIRNIVLIWIQNRTLICNQAHQPKAYAKPDVNAL